MLRFRVRLANCAPAKTLELEMAATATVAAMFGLKCVIYMGAVDCERQALNVYRMKMLGAEVVSVHAGQKTLKEAKKPCEIILYPDTPHGFNADYRPSYRKDKAEDGWKRLQEWFKKNGVA